MENTGNMSTSNSQETNADSGFQRKARPQSIIAQQFSAALDDLFKLSGIGALEESVEQKKDTVQSQRYQLEDLDAQLRETSDRLRRLEAKHRRRQSQMLIQQRSPVSSQYRADNDGEDSSGDSEGMASPQGEHMPR